MKNALMWLAIALCFLGFAFMLMMPDITFGILSCLGGLVIVTGLLATGNLKTFGD